MKRLLFACVISFIGISASFAGGAMRDNSPVGLEEGWRFSVAPYLWMGQYSGDVTVFAANRSVAVPFSKLFTNFDLGFQGHVEAGYGPWSVFFDPAYIPVSQGSSGTDVSFSVLDLDMGLYYRVYSRYLPTDRYLALELMGGVRYFSTQGTLYQAAANLTQSASMAAPMLGARFKYEFSPKFNLWLLGDVGGFGVDSLSNTWALSAGISYLVHRFVRVGLSYKLLKIDFRQPGLSMNGLIYGPMLGVFFSTNSR